MGLKLYLYFNISQIVEISVPTEKFVTTGIVNYWSINIQVFLNIQTN